MQAASGRRDQAIADFRKALALDPNDPRALANSAVIDREAGRYREMFDKLSRAREINPRAAGVLPSTARLR